MRIKKLSQTVIDQIAAGEIVERPSHLVKELVENSLDAGANKIEIEFRDGGRFVRVQDNGGGMSAEELPLAIERFATSKIVSSDDLWQIKTFGFRGEALASLSAVSKLTLISRQGKDSQANQLICEYGSLQEVVSVGGELGTTVQVESLFENLPARLKFLKSESAEGGQIKNTLKALALSRPDVEFRVVESGRLWMIYPPVESAIDRARQVLDLEKLYQGNAEREGVQVKAIFAGPHDVAKTTRNIWLFVNGRWVQDRGMQAAVLEAYRSVLMHGEYPQAVIWLQAEAGEVDVNIHPTKSQVKFRDPSLAFRATQAAIRQTLEQAPWNDGSSTSIGLDSRQPEALRNQEGATAVHPPQPSFLVQTPARNLMFSEPALNATVLKKKTFPESIAISMAELRETVQQGTWSRLEVLGQAHLTYILCQDRQNLILIDQHAAHERVAYERLMRAWRGGQIDVQEFLFPLAVDVSPEKMEMLLQVADELLRLGIRMESLGPSTVGINAGPSLLKDSVYGRLLTEMADEMMELGGSYSFEKAIGDLCATMACHSVVRAGQALSIEQMKQLLIEMDEFPLSSFCPHGRPVSIEIPFQKIERDFGRLGS